MILSLLYSKALAYLSQIDYFFQPIAQNLKQMIDFLKHHLYMPIGYPIQKYGS
jgi:hypothetical protein